MRKLIVIAILALLLTASMPPPLPSSYYGEISGAAPGAIVTAEARGVTVSTTAFAWHGLTVYRLDMPGDIVGTDAIEGGRAGDAITFRVGGASAGKAVWKSGTNTQVNLTVRRAKSTERRR